ncbi:hypothetical protein BP6252_07249 [Coleophoma cylindrospora]|uniref:Isotrichodermin C-15 hydroxylase n=1 Tax=Coleophoma cylindrospora TaxID=1849047 RepID=A0A3D8RH11_9HELO|nr:hypothetical protein BP6252_07249 [Coleophoma cylindrospora]
MLRGDMVQYLHALHEEYGEVVRFVPNEISFISASAWKEIYGHAAARTFVKDPGTYIRPTNGTASSILMANDADHARCRKLLTHAFSDRALREQHVLIQDYVESLIRNLSERAVGGSKEMPSVDMTQWYNFTTFDLIGDLAFGSPFDCLKESAMHPWVAMIFESVKGVLFFSVAQRYSPLDKVMLFFLGKSAQEKQSAHMAMTVEKVSQRLSMETDRPDFMSYILKYNDEKGMSREEIVANSSVLIKAGSETTATALSGATYFLLKNPQAMQKVVSEVRSSFKSVDEMDATSLANCKYLDACFKESLRMYPPVPVGLPRRATEATVVSGWHVPKDVCVRIPQWSQNYSPLNYHQPKSFVPERWLPNPPSPYCNDHLEAFEPFSLGPRNCLGKNLAWLEMRLILARVLYAFDLELVHDTWAPEDQKVFVLWQKPALDVKLVPRQLV